MSDEAVEQDLAIEEMMSRGQTIGNGMSRSQDGIHDLEGVNHINSVPPPSVGLEDQKLAGHRPPPPPPVASPPPPSGGMYAPQQVTAERLMYGDESAGKGKKKSSKQRFAERQVSELPVSLFCSE